MRSIRYQTQGFPCLKLTILSESYLNISSRVISRSAGRESLRLLSFANIPSGLMETMLTGNLCLRNRSDGIISLSPFFTTH